jgi:hypothetical protein
LQEPWPPLRAVSGPPALPAIQAAGYEHVLGGPLRQGGQRIGMLCFFPQPGTTYAAADLILFRGITDQVAVAVANILANEEILEREREKAILLSISEQLARVRNKEELLAVMLENLKPIFGFEEPSFPSTIRAWVRAALQPGRGEKARKPVLPATGFPESFLQDNPHQEFITYSGPRIV